MGSTVLRVAVLVAVHNRVAVTVAGLRRLEALSEKLCDEVAFSVFLVDDGSSDGTGERVGEIPLDLTVIPGTGSLFWNRGMVLAYRTARSSGKEFDAYMLYNDDVLLDDRFVDFVRQYIELDGVILVGALCDPQTGATTYSGVRHVPHRTRLNFAPVEPTGRLAPVDTFHANCVIVPANVFEALGGLDPAYTHYLGDFDLGLRATAMGVQSLLFGSPVGDCPEGVSHAMRVRSADFRERWRLLFHYPHHLGPEIYFLRRHSTPSRFPRYALQVFSDRLQKQFPVRPHLGRGKRACLRALDSLSGLGK